MFVLALVAKCGQYTLRRCKALVRQVRPTGNTRPLCFHGAWHGERGQCSAFTKPGYMDDHGHHGAMDDRLLAPCCCSFVSIGRRLCTSSYVSQLCAKLKRHTLRVGYGFLFIYLYSTFHVSDIKRVRVDHIFQHEFPGSVGAGSISKTSLAWRGNRMRTARSLETHPGPKSAARRGEPVATNAARASDSAPPSHTLTTFHFHAAASATRGTRPTPYPAQSATGPRRRLRGASAFLRATLIHKCVPRWPQMMETPSHRPHSPPTHRPPRHSTIQPGRRGRGKIQRDRTDRPHPSVKR